MVLMDTNDKIISLMGCHTVSSDTQVQVLRKNMLPASAKGRKVSGWVEEDKFKSEKEGQKRKETIKWNQKKREGYNRAYDSGYIYNK